MGVVQTTLSTTDDEKKNIMKMAFASEKESEKRMSPDSMRKLQDEINVLTKRNCELECQLKSLEAGNSKEVHTDSIDSTDIGIY